MDIPFYKFTFPSIIPLFAYNVKQKPNFILFLRGDFVYARFRIFIIHAAVMLVLPAGLILHGQQPVLPEEPMPLQPPAAELSGSYRVLNHMTGTVSEVPVRDYLIGAVGAEMSASCEPEALKAQVVACHTYAERIKAQNEDEPDSSLCGADFSDDSSRYQAFYTEDDLRRFYGEDFDLYYAKLADAVDAAGSLLLCYEGEPIAAAFHAISSGETESAETVWGNALPYLVPVESNADRSAPDYEETVSIPPDTLQKALCAQDPACSFPPDPAQWFTAPDCSPSGTVLQIGCGSITWSGQLLRTVLGLRSACFTVQYDGTQFLFTTHGFGHNVGMSQYGANAMAQEGCGFAEILAHYYPETVLTPVN